MGYLPTESEERQVMSLESQFSELKEFAAKEKLEIVLSAPVPAKFYIQRN
jgi:hypothetical protein